MMRDGLLQVTIATSVLLVLCGYNGIAADTLESSTQEEYIKIWKDEAVKQMKLYAIPASITLAQGILESGNGVSELAKKSNNHFGIKCHADWKGGRTYHDDDEKGECFRVYDHPRDSYEDHSKFLLRDRYASLFELELEDYKGWARGLKKCGYATNPKYPDLLITIIERHELYKLDNGKWVDKDESSLADVTGPKAPKAGAKHNIKTTENGIQYITVSANDSFESLSKELSMLPGQLRRYNEISKSHQFRNNEVIYLQPKRTRGSEVWHIVQQGESLWRVSQMYGIKMKSLARKNGLEMDGHLRAGMKLSLRWKLTGDGKLPWYAKNPS
jgi:LysM repeat protein